MSSELVKKLEDREHTLRENLFYESAEEYDQGYLHGFFEAMAIVEQHEAQQMKEPFYQLDEEQQNLLNDMKTSFNDGEAVEIIFEMVFEEYEERLTTLKLIQVFNAFTTWAIEQEKLKEEKQ